MIKYTSDDSNEALRASHCVLFIPVIRLTKLLYCFRLISNEELYTYQL